MRLFDYPQIVKKPMDLSTVKKNILKGKYQSYEDVFSDIQLVWGNCKTYNMSGSDIYLQAEAMERLSKKLIKQFKIQMGLAD